MTDMPRCKTCKHWVNATDYGWGECAKLPKWSQKMDLNVEPGGYFGNPVETSEDFGCVEHEERT